MCEVISTTDDNLGGDVPCPKCGKPLWFYRVYSEPLVVDKDIVEVGYTEWDEEYVICRECKHKPDHEWWEDQQVILA